MAMNRKAGLVIGFVLAAVFGMIFLGPVIQAVGSNTGTQSETNETVAANVGQFVDLGGYDIETDSETVWAYNDTSGSYEQATKGTDYEIAYNNGSVKALSGSSLIEDGEDIKVSYTYQASGGLTTTVVGFIPVMLGTLVLYVISRGVMKEM